MTGNRLVEFRVYRLKPGTRDQFHELVERHSIPMLAVAQMDVVAYGPSVNDPEGYFLFRSFNNAEHLEKSQSAFYTSDAWLKGPREAIVSLIESHESATAWLSEESVNAMKHSSVTSE